MMDVTTFKEHSTYPEVAAEYTVETEVVYDNTEDSLVAAEGEEMVVVDKQEEDVEFKATNDEKHVPLPSADFLLVFENIRPFDENNVNAEALHELCFHAWKQYYEASQQVVMEGNPQAWLSCSIYVAMVSRKFSIRSHPFPLALSEIQTASGVSVLELFDKLERYMEIVGASKRLKEHVQKIQGSLAVSAVIYKKLLPVFRALFLNTGPSATVISSHKLLKLLWSMFVLVKKYLSTEDLLSSFHLLLCIVEIIYDEVRKQELDELVNPEFSDKLIESGCGVLEYLCKCFGGVVLDAKHFKTHWFTAKKQTVLNLSEVSRFLSKHQQFSCIWNDVYGEIVVKRGEVDERIFTPTAYDDFERIFNEAYDGSAVELLRRGPDDSTFADVDLLLRMSTQQCLEKLTEYKKASNQASKTYILSSDNLYPSSPITTAIDNPVKLAALIPEYWQLAGSNLEIMCRGMRDDPLTTIACNAENFAQRFADKVIEEAEFFGEDYDTNIAFTLQKHQDMVRDLFYVMVEFIVRGERERGMDQDSEFCSVLRKEEFLASVFCCALELLLFSYGSVRSFPWSIQMCDLQAICFHKVIELVVRSVPNLTREMVKHLNKKEEEVLEEMAWVGSSPLWRVLTSRPDVVPTCEEAWKQPRQLVETYSPLKRRKREDGTHSPVPSFAGNMTTVLFFRKVYYLASIRMTDLCDRVRMTEPGRRICWGLLEHILRKEPSLMYNRHLDQNILCIIYVIAKYLKMSSTFVDVIAQYRHQPQARSQVYREVTVDLQAHRGTPSDDGNSRDSTSIQGHPRLRCASTIPTNSVPGTPEPSAVETVDLIKYYNKVFLPRTEDFVKSMQDQSEVERLLPLPKPLGFGLSPVKRALADRVHVQPLHPLSVMGERRLKYNINQTPRKELLSINRVVGMGHSSPFYSVSEVPDKSVFGPLYRR